MTCCTLRWEDEGGSLPREDESVDWTRYDTTGSDTTGCDCGHDGMGHAWHLRGCHWRQS